VPDLFHRSDFSVPHLRVAAGLLAAVISLALFVTPAFSASKFRATHSVSINGKVTANWTRTSSDTCDAVGSGSISIEYHSTETAKVKPIIATEGHFLGWVLAVPTTQKRSVPYRPMKTLRTTGTITTVDNTTQNPSSDPAYPCPATDKTGCGSRTLNSLKSSATATYYRSKSLDQKSIVAGLSPQTELPNKKHCIAPQDMLVRGPWDDQWRNYRLKMPSLSAFSAHKVLTVSGDFKRSTTSFLDNAGNVEAEVQVQVDDQVNVVFTKLK
jgi:hypothetical protein